METKITKLKHKKTATQQKMTQTHFTITEYYK